MNYFCENMMNYFCEKLTIASYCLHTKNATAGPGSDIDLLIHFTGNKNQLNDLNSWLDGWSVSLDYTNFLKTGYKSDGLLDVHIVTDEDIKNRTSFAIKIGAVTDAARELKLGTELN